MRVVTGYLDGHPVYRDEGPARARPVGFGGAAIGTFGTSTTLTAHQRRRNEPKKRTPRQPLGRREQPGEPR